MRRTWQTSSACAPALQKKRSRSRFAILACLLGLGAIATPATAQWEPSTRLVRCGEGNCLLISGYRDDVSQIVSVNGQTVSVHGERRWRTELPVETVRELCDPYAREIEVSLADPENRRELTANVDLPIGLLGGVNLQSIVINLN